MGSRRFIEAAIGTAVSHLASFLERVGHAGGTRDDVIVLIINGPIHSHSRSQRLTSARAGCDRYSLNTPNCGDHRYHVQ